MLIGARLIPLLFPMLAPPAEGGEVIAFDIGLGEGGEGMAPPPELFAPETEEEQEDTDEAPEETALDPASIPPCWWPAEPAPEPVLAVAEDVPALPPPDAGMPIEPPVEPAYSAETGELPILQTPEQSPDPESQPEPDARPAPRPASPEEEWAPTESPSAPDTGASDTGALDTASPDAGPSDPAQADPVPSKPAPLDRTPTERTMPPPAQAEPHRSAERTASGEDAKRPAAPPETPAAVDAGAQTDGLGDIQVMFEREGDATRITLIADRAETVDLMRRHADQLQTELAREGLADADLNFSERQQQRQHNGEGAVPGDTASAIALPPPVPASGLDLRL